MPHYKINILIMPFPTKNNNSAYTCNQVIFTNSSVRSPAQYGRLSALYHRYFCLLVMNIKVRVTYVFRASGSLKIIIATKILCYAVNV